MIGQPTSAPKASHLGRSACHGPRRARQRRVVSRSRIAILSRKDQRLGAGMDGDTRCHQGGQDVGGDVFVVEGHDIAVLGEGEDGLQVGVLAHRRRGGSPGRRRRPQPPRGR